MSPKSEHIDIRRAMAADAPVLAYMGRLTFTQSYASVIAAEELASYTSRTFGLERIRTELATAEITYLLALVEGTPCGYSKLEPTTPPVAVNGPNPVELARLYVLPEWIGQGIGTTLIRETLGAALERGCCSCWLRVWTENQRAIKFYRQCGFHEVGSEPYYVGRCSETVLLMIRNLSR
ncbi:MAG: GNAT family N-acetyltransferase [Phycisphaerales bacterium]|nr:MAG: GNAT family N-acetyltransferase [Phycisphaerales bacterium]